jgi:hypothetical protein
LGDGVARRLLGDPAYNSKELKKALAEVGILLATERSERRVERLYGQQAVRTPSRSHQGVVGMILTTDI